jgi:hypothetical protein
MASLPLNICAPEGRLHFDSGIDLVEAAEETL